MFESLGQYEQFLIDFRLFLCDFWPNRSLSRHSFLIAVLEQSIFIWQFHLDGVVCTTHESLSAAGNSHFEGRCIAEFIPAETCPVVNLIVIIIGDQDFVVGSSYEGELFEAAANLFELLSVMLKNLPRAIVSYP